MVDAHSEHRVGIVFVISAAVAWSTAPFFMRLLPFDPWTILFWRGVFGGSSTLAFWAAMRGRHGLRQPIRMSGGAWVVALLSTLGMVCFIPALQMTSVANVAVIIAAQPFVSAALAWIWLREAARLGTMLASLVAFFGLAIIVSGVEGSSDVRGIVLAIIMLLAISAMTVAIRRYNHTPMVAAAAMSNFLGSLVSIPFAHEIAGVTGASLSILAMFGLLQVGLGLTLFSLGSRHLPSGQASLIATLETPLMPFWVWLVFQELPSSRALLGGALVIGAVLADILSSMRSQAH